MRQRSLCLSALLALSLLSLIIGCSRSSDPSSSQPATTSLTGGNSGDDTLLPGDPSQGDTLPPFDTIPGGDPHWGDSLPTDTTPPADTVPPCDTFPPFDTVYGEFPWDTMPWDSFPWADSLFPPDSFPPWDTLTWWDTVFPPDDYPWDTVLDGDTIYPPQPRPDWDSLLWDTLVSDSAPRPHGDRHHPGRRSSSGR